MNALFHFRGIPQYVIPLIFLSGLLSGLWAAEAAREPFVLQPPPPTVKDRPCDFVELSEFIPSLALELRYHRRDNFLGRRVEGYGRANCWLTLRAAEALKRVQEELGTMGFGLKIFDAYRPQRAVNDFVAWSMDETDERAKAEYYPDVPKGELFERGFIAERSSHTRGSTLDLTLVDLRGGCARELDMGSPFDFFGEISATESVEVSAVARAHRLLLRSVMDRHGFKNYPKEWWHFTLREEPYPETYFDFEP